MISFYIAIGFLSNFFIFLKSGELTLLNSTVIVKMNRDRYFNNVNTFKTELVQNYFKKQFHE